MTRLDSGGQRSRSQQAVKVEKAFTSTPGRCKYRTAHSGLVSVNRLSCIALRACRPSCKSVAEK